MTVQSQTRPKSPVEIEKVASIPRHVAVIMDGNGRWARQRGLPRLKGHEAGAEAVVACLRACNKLGVSHLTLYAFSTENWKRPQAEVDGLMTLLRRFLDERGAEIDQYNVRLNAIGRIHELPTSTRRALLREIERTSKNTGGTLTFALNYSGRAEITDAVRQIAQEVAAGTLRPAEVTETVITSRLYTHDLPDPDLLIRSSGEMRLSNFLLWQLSYTEIHVTHKLWPDFQESDFFEAVRDYSQRHRRYGAI